MKKIIFFLTLILCVYITYRLYNVYLDTKDKEVFENMTGISKFELLSDVRNDHYFYMIAKISSSDKQMMLKKHYFKLPPVNLKGKLSYELHSINENDYLYYLEDVGHGYLGYVLYFISKADNRLIVYTSYAD